MLSWYIQVLLKNMYIQWVYLQLGQVLVTPKFFHMTLQCLDFPLSYCYLTSILVSSHGYSWCPNHSGIAKRITTPKGFCASLYPKSCTFRGSTVTNSFICLQQCHITTAVAGRCPLTSWFTDSASIVKALGHIYWWNACWSIVNIMFWWFMWLIYWSNL